jgi:hypothetical protein
MPRSITFILWHGANGNLGGVGCKSRWVTTPFGKLSFRWASCKRLSVVGPPHTVWGPLTTDLSREANGVVTAAAGFRSWLGSACPRTSWRTRAPERPCAPHSPCPHAGSLLSAPARSRPRAAERAGSRASACSLVTAPSCSSPGCPCAPPYPCVLGMPVPHTRLPAKALAFTPALLTPRPVASLDRHVSKRPPPRNTRAPASPPRPLPVLAWPSAHLVEHVEKVLWNSLDSLTDSVKVGPVNKEGLNLRTELDGSFALLLYKKPMAMEHITERVSKKCALGYFLLTKRTTSCRGLQRGCNLRSLHGAQ